MSDPNHFKILKKGVEEWNHWRRNNPSIVPDLSGTYLAKADLEMAWLDRVNFNGAQLNLANLKQAHLTGAKFKGSKLNGANLSWANLNGANLNGADLSEAVLAMTNINRADFINVKICNTIFAATNLNTVINLKLVNHAGPSTIGLDTFFLSSGKIPEVFLRGAGVPDIFIEYASSLVGKTIEFYSVFISYSSKDEDLAKRLHADLQAKRVRCWLASEDLKIGDKFRFEIDHAIRAHDKLLLLLSVSSLQSDWVEKEVESAFDRERHEKRTALFPIRLDDTVMDTVDGWAADIRRTRHIGDFREWKNHDAYQKAFDRLLRDLKSDRPLMSS